MFRCLTILGRILVIGLLLLASSCAVKEPVTKAPRSYGEERPISEKFWQSVEEKGVLINLITESGKVMVFDIKGRPLASCKTPHDTATKGNCSPTKVNQKLLNTIVIFSFKHNPLCIGQYVGDVEYQVHAGGDGFPKGAFECHNAPH